MDYYAILGVSKTASDAEIKAAFRILAKTFHPDKNPTNPNAATLFAQILKAYNTLINPHTRKRYDYSVSPQSASTVTHAGSSKQRRTAYKENNAVSAEELKRRNYYQTHYKQAEKKVATQAPQNYSDYKYILYATPIAVGLLMLVVSMFTNEPSVSKEKQKTVLQDSIVKTTN